MINQSKFYKDIGKDIKAKRLANKLTQAQLAERLNISRASVANIEVGRQQILLHTYFDIYKAINGETTIKRDIIRI